jgi:hypothetical protein
LVAPAGFRTAILATELLGWCRLGLWGLFPAALSLIGCWTILREARETTLLLALAAAGLLLWLFPAAFLAALRTWSRVLFMPAPLGTLVVIALGQSRSRAQGGNRRESARNQPPLHGVLHLFTINPEGESEVPFI